MGYCRFVSDYLVICNLTTRESIDSVRHLMKMQVWDLKRALNEPHASEEDLLIAAHTVDFPVT